MATASQSNLARLRMVLWGLVILAGIGATILYVFFPPQRAVIGVAGGEFTLQSTDGGTFTEADLRGEPSLVFFGYTYCPDVCPTTLSDTALWRERLGIGEDDLNVIMISVDPERDDVEHLKTYLGGFPAPVTGLTGDPEEVEKAKAAFGAVSEKVESAESTEYLVNHTASVFLLNSEGGFEGTIAYGEPTDSAIGKIRRLIGS